MRVIHRRDCARGVITFRRERRLPLCRRKFRSSMPGARTDRASPAADTGRWLDYHGADFRARRVLRRRVCADRKRLIRETRGVQISFSTTRDRRCRRYCRSVGRSRSTRAGHASGFSSMVTRCRSTPRARQRGVEPPSGRIPFRFRIHADTTQSSSASSPTVDRYGRRASVADTVEDWRAGEFQVRSTGQPAARAYRLLR